MKSCPICDTPYPDQHATCPTDGAVLIATRELQPGYTVRGKYRVVRKLGEGGMGVVYQAEHMMLGGQLALKFLASDLSRNPQFIKRFRQEARAAYQLRHPNIVEVIDLDQDEDGSLFIAMEYVDGPSLRSAMSRNKGPLKMERALAIARGVAAGLAAAHARKVVHRDIKPENILLTSTLDGSEQVKVLDFGIAAMAEGLSQTSRTRGLMLTPEYASPEQWRGTPSAELDGRTDLYALGGVLYEMLAGRTPFHAETMEGWMFEHLQAVPEPLGKLRPDLARQNPELNTIVMKLLARNREERFPTAITAIEALSAPSPAPKPMPVVAPPPPHRPATVVETPAAPAPKPVVKAPVAPPPEPEVETPRKKTGLAVGLGLAAVAVIGVVMYLFGAFNSGSGAAAETPRLSPGGGTYASQQAVEISDATPGAAIHYTVDGSAPTQLSPVYTAPLTDLPSGAVVRAMATASGHQASPDVTGVYIWDRAAPPAVKGGTGSPYDQGKSAFDHKQYVQARTLFTQACDGGDSRGCNYLGYLFAQGLGGAENAESARQLYKKACDQNNYSSCASLGSLYQDAGYSAEARKYFQKACDGHLQEACTLRDALQ